MTGRAGVLHPFFLLAFGRTRKREVDFTPPPPQRPLRQGECDISLVVLSRNILGPVGLGIFGQQSPLLFVAAAEFYNIFSRGRFSKEHVLSFFAPTRTQVSFARVFIGSKPALLLGLLQNFKAFKRAEVRPLRNPGPPGIGFFFPPSGALGYVYLSPRGRNLKHPPPGEPSSHRASQRDPGNLTQGKAGNQLMALRFCKGFALQASTQACRRESRRLDFGRVGLEKPQLGWRSRSWVGEAAGSGFNRFQVPESVFLTSDCISQRDMGTRTTI